MQWGGASGVFGVHHRLSAEGAGEAKKARELMKKFFEMIIGFKAIPMWLASFACSPCKVAVARFAPAWAGRIFINNPQTFSMRWGGVGVGEWGLWSGDCGWVLWMGIMDGIMAYGFGVGFGFGFGFGRRAAKRSSSAARRVGARRADACGAPSHEMLRDFSVSTGKRVAQERQRYWRATGSVSRSL